MTVSSDAPEAIHGDAEIWQHTLIGAALDAVMIIDDDGYLVDFNPSAEATFGYKRADVLGKRMSDLIVPPTLRQAHIDGLARLKSTQVPKILGKRLELSAMRCDGTEFPVELIVVQVPIKPRPLYVGYVRDISDRKQAEEAWRALADSSPLMIWVADVDGSVSWFNKSWLEFTGVELNDVIGSGWINVMHKSDIASYMGAYNESLRKGSSFSTEFRLRHVDGSYHWMLGNVAPTLSPDGTISGFAGSCVDITSRRETEMALQLTQFATDCAADAIFWLRPDGSLHYVNDQACRSLGFSREELLGRRVDEFSPSIPSGSWKGHWKELKETKSLTFETEHRRSDGSTFPVEITVNHIEFQKSEFGCAFARDITERRDAQAALAEAMHQAQAANRAKSEFLAIVSHEMRTPLNSILGTVDLTLQTAVSDEQKQMMTLCRQSGTRLRELINDILDYSQIQAGRFSLQSKEMKLGRLLDRVRELFTQRTQEKGLEFRWQVSREVPSAVVGDERRLYQVIENLLNNAVKFTDSGYVAFRAAVDKISDGSISVQFVVEDTGIGVAPENRERIFQRFEQVDSGPTRQFGGIGLGLSICAHLADLMEGNLRLEDGPCGGSRFSFTVTFGISEHAAKDKVDEEDGMRAGADLTQPTPYLQGLKVLLAEDDPPSSIVVRRMLEGVGVDVTCVVDGVQAVQAIRENPREFDAVFMDVMMPRLDGIEATRQIRELPDGNLPVVAMTAQAMVGDRERILRSHVDAYIAKPIERDLVLSTLGELARPESLPNIDSGSEALVTGNKTFDYAALQQRCGFDDDWVREVADLFKETYGETVARIKKGLADRDQQEVVNAVHRLKGAVANMCATKAWGICESMEAQAHSGELDLVKSQMNALETEIQLVVTMISKRLATA